MPGLCVWIGFLFTQSRGHLLIQVSSKCSACCTTLTQPMSWTSVSPAIRTAALTVLSVTIATPTWPCHPRDPTGHTEFRFPNPLAYMPAVITDQQGEFTKLFKHIGATITKFYRLSWQKACPVGPPRVVRRCYTVHCNIPVSLRL